MFLSEEDISTIKVSLYLLKKVSLKISRNKEYGHLINTIITLCLVATSRICSNSKILEDKLSEVKENVTNSLKDTMAHVTTEKVGISFFNVGYKPQLNAEIQVRDS